MKNSILIFLLAVFTIYGCKSTEKVRYNTPQPEWVKQTPNNAFYYIGIASVKKTVFDFKNAAKRSALDNLASEISVNISSESVLKSLETNDSFQQEYKQNIQLNSSEKLEGFELVDSWENETEYWVYYQLSKSKHQEIKNEKRNNAKVKAEDLFNQAQALTDFQQSFLLCIQALEVLSEYFSEPIKTNINGKETDLAFAIVSYIRTSASDLKMSFPYKSNFVKIGETIERNISEVTILNKTGEPVSNLPITFKHKSTFVKTDKTLSNNEGVAYFPVGKITDKLANQSLTAEINFEELAKKITYDRIILKFIEFIPTQKAATSFIVSFPKVYIEGTENEFGKSQQIRMNAIISQAFIQQGFEIVQNKKHADLIVKYNTTTSNVGKVRDASQIILEGKFEVYNRENQLVFSDVIPQQKALHPNPTLAANEAMDKAGKYFTRRIFTSFTNQYLGY